jgi:hypothetical protein
MPSRLARYCPLPEFEGRVSPSNGYRHQHSTEIGLGQLPTRCCRHLATLLSIAIKNGLLVQRVQANREWTECGAAALSSCIARVHCVGVGRIEPHDQQRDVVEGPAIIGLREQLRRGNLGCGLRVQRSRDRLVRHHLR